MIFSAHLHPHFQSPDHITMNPDPHRQGHGSRPQQQRDSIPLKNRAMPQPNTSQAQQGPRYEHLVDHCYCVEAGNPGPGVYSLRSIMKFAEHATGFHVPPQQGWGAVSPQYPGQVPYAGQSWAPRGGEAGGYGPGQYSISKQRNFAKDSVGYHNFPQQGYMSADFGGYDSARTPYGYQPLQHNPPISTSVGTTNPDFGSPRTVTNTYTTTPRHRPLNPAAAECTLSSPEKAAARDSASAIAYQASENSTVRLKHAQSASPDVPTEADLATMVSTLAQAVDTTVANNRQCQTPKERVDILNRQKSMTLDSMKAARQEMRCTEAQLEEERAGHGSDSERVIKGLEEQLNRAERDRDDYGWKYKELAEKIEEAFGDNAILGVAGNER